MPKPQITMRVVLSEKQREAVKEKALGEGRSVSAVIRALLGAWVKGKFDPWAEEEK